MDDVVRESKESRRLVVHERCGRRLMLIYGINDLVLITGGAVAI
jgi:hypothetical protein